jgi:hypothetical protein
MPESTVGHAKKQTSGCYGETTERSSSEGFNGASCPLGGSSRIVVWCSGHRETRATNFTKPMPLALNDDDVEVWVVDLRRPAKG